MLKTIGFLIAVSPMTFLVYLALLNNDLGKYLLCISEKRALATLFSSILITILGLGMMIFIDK